VTYPIVFRRNRRSRGQGIRPLGVFWGRGLGITGVGSVWSLYHSIYSRKLHDRESEESPPCSNIFSPCGNFAIAFLMARVFVLRSCRGFFSTGGNASEVSACAIVLGGLVAAGVVSGLVYTSSRLGQFSGCFASHNRSSGSVVSQNSIGKSLPAMLSCARRASRRGEEVGVRSSRRNLKPPWNQCRREENWGGGTS